MGNTYFVYRRLSVSSSDGDSMLEKSNPQYRDCISSILRTYRTSILIESPNDSPNIIVMGCWAAAEIGIGVLVFCLPVTPRFLQFLNSRSRSKTGIRNQSRSKSGHDCPSKTPRNEHSDVYPMTTLTHVEYDREDTDNCIKVESSINVEYIQQPYKAV